MKNGLKDTEDDYRCREIETLLVKRGIKLPLFWSAEGRRKYLRDMEERLHLQGVMPWEGR